MKTKITPQILIELGFEKITSISYDWKDEYVLKRNDDYCWDIGFIIGDYPENNPNIGCVSIGVFEPVEMIAIPPDLYNKPDWSEEDEDRANNYFEISDPWRQPIAYHVQYVEQLLDIINSLRIGQEPLIYNATK